MLQRELAPAAAVCFGGMDCVLTAWIGKGLVALRNFPSTEDRRRYAHFLKPKGISDKAAITLRFLARKNREHEGTKAEIETLTEEISSEGNIRHKWMPSL